MRKTNLGTIVVSLLLAFGFSRTSAAQNATSGSISGKVTVKSSGEAAVGATIVVTGPALQGPQTAIAGESGQYTVSSLPPGSYVMVFYYLDGQTKRSDVRININKTVIVNQAVAEREGEVIEVTGSSTVDTSTAKQSISLGRDYLENIPMAGTNFDGALGAAGGTQGDQEGVSFSGSTSLENQYIVDGVNTTGLSYGTVGAPLANDFIEEIEVITGGYQAEYGRSTGGIANVRTKQGSNELKGSVIARFSGESLAVDFERVPTQASSIDAVNNITQNWQIGFDLGGPIIKDKLWFYVGFQPQLISRRTDRIFKRRRDCFVTLEDGSQSTCQPENADGTYDEDENGFFIYENIGQESFDSQQQTYQFISKFNYALSPEHQGVLSLQGQPYSNEIIGVYGEKSAVGFQQQAISGAGSAEWTSKFNDNKTEVQARLGYYYEASKAGSINGEFDDQVQTRLLFQDLGSLLNEYEPTLPQAILDGCNDDSPNDPYTLIENCPDAGVGYRVGGPGGLSDESGSRLSGKLTVLQRLALAGDHQLKAGVDFEINKLNKQRLISGDVFYTVQPGQTESFRWVESAPPGTSIDPADPSYDPRYGDLCDRVNSSPGVACDWTPDPNVQGETVNWSAFAQDSWQILPNVTLNAGIRYEEQRLRFADELQNTVSPFTGDSYGTNAMVIKNMWAPRVGVVYDWTKEGRSKVFANWGRFFQNIPMDINDRSFGGETDMRTVYNEGDCNNGQGGEGAECEDINAPTAPSSEILRGAGILVEPDIGGQFIDEILIGAEYEILEDVKLGLTYENRRYGQVIEDVSVDNGNTLILANPGSFSESAEQELAAEIDALAEDDPNRIRLEDQLAQFRGIRTFDKPVRNWNAIRLIGSKRFSKSFYVQGSYQYARATGNYEGLFSSNSGQVDPNITSQYDLIELLANRFGPLPQDRPHQMKLDGFYTFDFEEAGRLTTSLSIRAYSGNPVNALGRHYRYGFDEASLVPRGSVDRTPFFKDADMMVKYGKDIRRGMALEVFFELFNFTSFSFLNGQQVASVDETYTIDYTNPVVGGEQEDLVFAKAQTAQGAELSTPITRNPNFRNVTSRWVPPYARLGVRLTF